MKLVIATAMLFLIAVTAQSTYDAAEPTIQTTEISIPETTTASYPYDYTYLYQNHPYYQYAQQLSMSQQSLYQQYVQASDYPQNPQNDQYQPSQDQQYQPAQGQQYQPTQDQQYQSTQGQQYQPSQDQQYQQYLDQQYKQYMLYLQYQKQYPYFIEQYYPNLGSYYHSLFPNVEITAEVQRTN